MFPGDRFLLRAVPKRVVDMLMHELTHALRARLSNQTPAARRSASGFVLNVGCAARPKGLALRAPHHSFKQRHLKYAGLGIVIFSALRCARPPERDALPL
jgi:hypothetical protein